MEVRFWRFWVILLLAFLQADAYAGLRLVQYAPQKSQICNMTGTAMLEIVKTESTNARTLMKRTG